MTVVRPLFAAIGICIAMPVFAQPAGDISSVGNADQQMGNAALEAGISVEVAEERMPKQPLRESRLWLPPSLDSLQPFLVTAAFRAMQNPDCRDVLYGSVNEFRTENGEPTFTILCMQNPRHTFNLIFPQSILMPSVPEEVQQETREAEAQLDRLRNLLQSDATPPDNNEQLEVLEEEETEKPPPEVF